MIAGDAGVKLQNWTLKWCACASYQAVPRLALDRYLASQAFTDHYYNTFDTNRQALGPLYQEQSLMNFQGAKSVGSAAIQQKLTALPFKQCKHQITSIDAQQSMSQGINIVVTGQIIVSCQPGLLRLHACTVIRACPCLHPVQIAGHSWRQGSSIPESPWLIFQSRIRWQHLHMLPMCCAVLCCVHVCSLGSTRGIKASYQALATHAPRLATKRSALVICLQTEGESQPLKFSQFFHLAPAGGSFVISNGMPLLPGRWLTPVSKPDGAGSS